MKKKLLYIVAVSSYSFFMQGMNSNFFKPATVIPKIRFANNAFFTINPVYSRTFSEKSYDQLGAQTGLFQWGKPETLLNSFNDTTLDITDTTSAGNAYIMGKSIIHETALLITKNIKHGLFADIQIFQQYLTIKNLALIPLDNHNEPFESEEALELTNPALADYVKVFKKNHVQFQEKAKKTYFLNQTYLWAGYTNSWNHFSQIDFIDFTCKLGLLLNLSKVKNNLIFDLPLHKSNGFCLEANSAIGVLNWINIGATLATKIYPITQQTVALNTNSIDNSFLKPYKNQATLRQRPFFYGNIYIEGDHIEGGLSLLLGYAYAVQMKTTVTTNDLQASNYDNNPQTRYAGWSSGSLLCEIEYDFATEKRRNVPAIKLIFIQPLHGKNVFKSAAQAISCCLQFSHVF